MIFDKQEHKEIVLQLIEKASFPGHLIEIVADFKKTVEKSTVMEPNKIIENNIKQ